MKTLATTTKFVKSMGVNFCRTLISGISLPLPGDFGGNAPGEQSSIRCTVLVALPQQVVYAMVPRTPFSKRVLSMIKIMTEC